MPGDVFYKLIVFSVVQPKRYFAEQEADAVLLVSKHFGSPSTAVGLVCVFLFVRTVNSE